MKKPLQIEFESDFVKCSISDRIAVLKFKCNAFEALTNLDHANKVLPWFDLVENDPNIKGVIVFTEKNCQGEDAYVNFLSEITGRKIEKDKLDEITRFEKSDIRAIEINMLIILIRKIYSFKKIFFSTVNGEISTPFLGLSLASDFRFVTNDFKMLFSHVKFGLHPSGAVPYLLPKYLNRQVAMNYLLRGGSINAEEALRFNLVNEILPSENFEEDCIKKANDYVYLSMSTLKSTKSLMNINLKELEDYFNIESNYTYK